MANITVKELAVLAETSVATISRVLNGDTHVAEETRQRIQQVIASTGYVPRKSAKRDETSQRILVILPSLRNPYFYNVLRGVESSASAEGYAVLTCATHRDSLLEKQYLKMLSDKLVDGVILFTTALPDSELNALAAEYPIIQCGAMVMGSAISYAAIDDRAAAYDAISYLSGLGHTRIASILFENEQLPFVRLRRAGYMDALRDNAIPYTPAYELYVDNNRTAGYEAMEQLMSLPAPPTAVFAFSDLVAIGVYNYLYEHNLTPGKDIDVLGFDGTYLSDSLHPKLSVVRQPAHEMGKSAFNMLKERLSDPGYVTRKIILNHELVIRDSTHKIK